MKKLTDILSLSDILSLVLPLIVISLGIVLSLVKIPLPLMDLVRPDMLVVLVYFWAVYRPDFLNPALIFMAGLVVDLLIGVFIGLTPVLLIVTYMVIKGQRRFLMAQNFFIQWLCFGLTALAKGFSEWGVVSLLSWEWIPPIKQSIVLGLTIFLFPFVALVLVRVHRLMERGL